ncbi:MAG TPA: MFS transporter [Acidimicrobiales bacterium]|nr:MFS transporter [Acidimicrobiales bacterium]
MNSVDQERQRDPNLLALITLCAVLFLTFLDTTIVSVALASIQSELHAGVSQLQWIVNGYALTFASLMLLAGSLSDRFGRKRVMLIGLIIFGAGSLLGALASSPGLLIAARVVMGIGAAASEPGTLSMLRHLYPEPEQRARALGAWASVSGLALAIGPVIGGALVAIGTFRAVFWFNVGAALCVGLLMSRTVPESVDPVSTRLDISGFVVGVIGIGSLTFAITLGETVGYRAPLVVSLFLVGVLALTAFVRIERSTPSPMLDMMYFQSPRFTGAIVVAFILFFSIFSIFFFTALYLTAVIGYSPDRVAVEFLPMALAMIAAAGIAGSQVARVGPGLPMAQGCLLGGAGILLSEVLLGSSQPSAWLMATLALAGFGFGLSVVPMTSVVLSEVPPAHSGMAASTTNTSRELGAVFGVAVLGALVNAHLNGDLTHRLKELRIPSNFISIIISAIETGSVPAGVTGGGSRIEVQVIHAAYNAFQDGLKEALLTAGIGMLIAGIVAAATLGQRAASKEHSQSN